MSNLLKYNSVVIKNNEKMTIDSNRLMNDILAQNAMPMNVTNPDRVPDEDGFISGLDASIVEQLVADTEEEPGFDPDILVQNEAMLSDAREEAERILAEAREEAERITAAAHQLGYDAGMEEANRKADGLLAARRQELEDELEARRDEMERQYVELRSQMEPQLVDTLLTVFTRITRTIADDKKDMIYFLVDNVLRNAEMSHEFTIRVSEDDYKFLVNNKNKLYGVDNPDIRIDIVKDISLDRNQSIIETDTGVFDCSLDIQLDNLREAIHLLSCLQE